MAVVKIKLYNYFDSWDSINKYIFAHYLLCVSQYICFRVSILIKINLNFDYKYIIVMIICFHKLKLTKIINIINT